MKLALWLIVILMGLWTWSTIINYECKTCYYEMDQKKNEKN